MSIRAMNWAWQIALPPTPKLVLMALADIADDSGICWPGQQGLAVKCSVTVRTVQRILILLQSQRLLSTEPRFRNDGARTSNKYKLALNAPHDKLSGEGVVDDRGPTTPVSPPPDTGVVVTTTEPPGEPSQPPPAALGRRSRLHGGGGGDLIFPVKLSLADREALAGQLVAIPQPRAQEILDELAGRMRIAAVKNPVRYCLTLVARLRNGQFAPELALKVAERRDTENASKSVLAEIHNRAPVELGHNASALPERQRAVMERVRTASRLRFGVRDPDDPESPGQPGDEGAT